MKGVCFRGKVAEHELTNNVEDSGGISLKSPQGGLLASGPVLGVTIPSNLVFVRHLPKRHGSRTPGLEFCCKIVSRGKGIV